MRDEFNRSTQTERIFGPLCLGFKTPYACDDGLVDLLTSAPGSQKEYAITAAAPLITSILREDRNDKDTRTHEKAGMCTRRPLSTTRPGRLQAEAI
jgi:hypothetical protein